MSTPTEIYNDTDVERLRELLGKVGRQQYQTVENEIQMAIRDDLLLTDFNDIAYVVGIWDETDFVHSGTNYALLSGVQFDGKNGKIFLPSGTLTLGNKYLLSYVYYDGLNDRQIQRCLDDADSFINASLYQKDNAVVYDNTEVGKIAYTLKMTVAMIYALDIMNTSNIIQDGFNYSIGEVRVETKLWGEGMSAQTYVEQLEKKKNELLDMLKLMYGDGKLVYSISVDNRARYHKNRNQKMARRNTSPNVDTDYIWMVIMETGKYE